MKTYFETTVSYEKTLESGKQKVVSEHYLVEAVSFSDAEYRIIEFVTPFAPAGLFVKDIRRKNISDLLLDETAEYKYYDCKVNFITVDEETGGAKKTSSLYLVQASTTDNAGSALRIFLKGSMEDWEIHTIRETKILDIIRSSTAEEKVVNF